MNFIETPIGAAFDVLNGATPSSSEGSYWDGDIPWITPTDIGSMRGREIAFGNRYITQEGHSSCGTQLVPAGSIILSIRAPIGHIAIAGVEMCFNQGCRGLAPRRIIKTQYAYWALVARKPQLEAAGQGTTFIELNRSKLRAERIPIPSLEDQVVISDFLDREIARIDQLIEKRENFLKLIEEKKTTIISKVISGSILNQPTNGYSGWFGSLPIDWKVRRAKFLFRERQDRSKTGNEELLTVSHITGVTKRSEKDVNMFLAESNEGYKLVSKGDIVINTMWAWMGAQGISPVDGLISPSYGVYEPISDSYEFEYFDLLLRSRPFIAEATRRSKGIHSSRLRLYPDAFLDILLPVPSKDIQRKMLEVFQSATKRDDRLAELNRQSLILLREFRSALITAAVTGQIDVKTWGKQGNADRRLDQIEEEMTRKEATA